METLADKLLNSMQFTYAAKVIVSEKPYDKIIDKALEELSELTTVLLQKKNKPNKVSDEDIGTEIIDVQQHLIILSMVFDNKVNFDKLIVGQLNKLVSSKNFKSYLESYKAKAST